ncbi:MAG TPA: aldo/keto reductase [Terriglobia bacterium]|nr:aldo/keto reductase [Terriglobia bacterium]
MNRREFLTRTAAGLGAAYWGSLGSKSAFALPSSARFSATDIVTLGNTGIRTSRLAMGTGTVGSEHHSHQTALGIQGLANLLEHGFDQGLRFFDVADSYGSHPHAAEALKHLPREKVTILTKSWARDAAGMRADIDRFRKELGVDHIDILLMHCLTEDDWTTRFRGVMDVMSEAKEKGIIRAHGCSCHSLGALKASAASPWVEVQLARINPISSHMDADPPTIAGVLRQMHDSGKAVVGMKILGQGDMRDRADEALKYALSLGVLSAFTIGAESRQEQDDLVHRIAAVNVVA